MEPTLEEKYRLHLLNVIQHHTAVIDIARRRALMTAELPDVEDSIIERGMAQRELAALDEGRATGDPFSDTPRPA